MSLFLHTPAERDSAAAALDRARDHLREAISDVETAMQLVRISEVDVIAGMWEDHVQKLDAYIGRLQ